MTEVTFDCTTAEREAAIDIAHRAYAMTKQAGRRKHRPAMEFAMDLIAVHSNGCPLDFERMRAADDFNLAHDVFGIERHLDRATGQLRDFFVPRFSLRQ